MIQRFKRKPLKEKFSKDAVEKTYREKDNSFKVFIGFLQRV